MNRNAAAVRRLVERRGGAVIAERDGGKHLHMQVRTALGAVFWLTVERGTSNDKRKRMVWADQAMRRADAGIGRR